MINDVFGANAEAADRADGVLERSHCQVDVGDLYIRIRYVMVANDVYTKGREVEGVGGGISGEDSDSGMHREIR